MILKDFLATEIFSADSQNVAVSSESELYTWGGSTAEAMIKTSESKLSVMEDLKRRNVAIVAAAYSSIVLITGQESFSITAPVAKQRSSVYEGAESDYL